LTVQVQDKKVRAFLAELAEVCRRHGLALDTAGYDCPGFVVEKYSADHEVALLNAQLRGRLEGK
jgi:hypothetical protein